MKHKIRTDNPADAEEKLVKIALFPGDDGRVGGYAFDGKAVNQRGNVLCVCAVCQINHDFRPPLLYIDQSQRQEVTILG